MNIFKTLNLSNLLHSGSKKLSVLTTTTDFNSLDEEGAVADFFKAQYSNATSKQWIDNAFVTLVNAIYTQNRGAFILTRKGLADLLRNDKNQDIGLKNDNYSKFILMVTTSNVLSLDIQKSNKSGRDVYVCKVINKEILEMLELTDNDVENQYNEVVEFLTGKIVSREETLTEKAIEVIETKKEEVIVTEVIAEALNVTVEPEIEVSCLNSPEERLQLITKATEMIEPAVAIVPMRKTSFAIAAQKKTEQAKTDTVSNPKVSYNNEYLEL